ncbi:MAG: hypothetical protein U1E17_05460 [Geminicoccaceae bacterium]
MLRAIVCTIALITGLAWPAAAAPGPTPLPRAVWGGVLSGLPWTSGANGSLDDFEAWRGLRLDVRTTFLGLNTWRHMVASTMGVEWTAAKGSQVVVAMGMLPRTQRGQHARCAAGRFDAWIRAVGKGLVDHQGGNAILRLGWEANRVGGFPWAVTGDGTDYKACFRRWVSILRAVPGQSFTIDWNMGAKGTFPYHVDRMYPGDDVVDVIGVQQYDRCPPSRSEAEWLARANSVNPRAESSPVGIYRWLDYATSKGKRLSVPEWGIGGPRSVCRQPGIDNAVVIRKMYEFFRDHADQIAYEGYFNASGTPSDAGGTCKLAPSFYNPSSSDMYKTLWTQPIEPPPPPAAP